MTRKGLYDHVFAIQGDSPVAFSLDGTPFGKEPLDVVDNRYDIKIGSYEDCFDGYIFLQALKEEAARYRLPELMTKDFFEEIRRRASIVGAEDYIMYSDVKIKDTDYEELLMNREKEKLDKSRRWMILLP